MSQKSKVYWLSGPLHERKLALEKIKSQFSSADNIVVDGSFTVAYLEKVLRQESCFSDEKIVIVKTMPYPTGVRQTMVNHLKKLIDSIPDNSVLVFDGIPSSEEKAISGHVGKVGHLYTQDEKISAEDAPSWVVDVLANMGKDISVTDAELLVDTCGHDKKINGIGADVLRLSCEKLALYLGNRKKIISTDDILLTSMPSQDFVIWKIFDAMDSKDICACYNAFGRLCDTEQSVISSASILFAISLPRYRMLLFLKESLAAGKPKHEIAKNVASIIKLSSEGKDWGIKVIADPDNKPAFTDFVINSALNGGYYGKKPTVDLYSRKDIVKIINTLYNGSQEIRARSKSESAIKLLVDALFLSVCTSFDDKIIENMCEAFAYV